MCPACMAAALLVIAGSTSAGGAGVVLAKKLRARRHLARTLAVAATRVMASSARR
jgi:hydroxymethylpyrimidine/phosphomethylpyrimidine kinase